MNKKNLKIIYSESDLGVLINFITSSFALTKLRLAMVNANRANNTIYCPYQSAQIGQDENKQAWC